MMKKQNAGMEKQCSCEGTGRVAKGIKAAIAPVSFIVF